MIKQQIQKPKEWVRVYTDRSEDSQEAVKLLRKAGYRVLSLSNSQGTMGPELELDRHTYRGLKEIKELVKT